MLCGLLGQKLGHSYSPQIHHYLGSYPYALYEKQPDELGEFLKNGNFTGLNVTIPYKKDVLPYCQNLSVQAQKLGAVNTIVKRSDGTLMGHNTDYFGFHSMVKNSGLNVNGKKVLVLGSGGASVTAVAVLEELGAKVIVISRCGENNYNTLNLHVDASVIVNTTPVGMYPNTGKSPINLDDFPNLEGVLDLIYNPARTKLLMDAEKRGLITENGLWMLVAQAKESAEWFTGVKIDNSVIPKIYKLLRRKTENIILIGMPGCGKTTIGKALADHLGMTFIDADPKVEELAGMPIPRIFAQLGEDAFRAFETKVLHELGKHSGLVIATGGGCVTRNENYDALHQNGTILWIQRDLSLLPTEGRPLSQKESLDKMYAVRKPLYEAFADHTFHNNGPIASIIDLIVGEVYA